MPSSDSSSEFDVVAIGSLDTLLPECDRDIVAWLSRSFRKRGITVHTGAQVKGQSAAESGTTVLYDAESVTVDAVVVAVGDAP
jgi:dihydrolipoamide dehydrogenase